VKGNIRPPVPVTQAIGSSLQLCPVIVGQAPLASPDHQEKKRLKEYPHVVKDLTGKIGLLHTLFLPLRALVPVKILQQGGFVS
jgi:hypothetical protein